MTRTNTSDVSRHSGHTLDDQNNPPNCPPTSVLLVLQLKFYTKNLACNHGDSVGRKLRDQAVEWLGSAQQSFVEHQIWRATILRLMFSANVGLRAVLCSWYFHPFRNPTRLGAGATIPAPRDGLAEHPKAITQKFRDSSPLTRSRLARTRQDRKSENIFLPEYVFGYSRFSSGTGRPFRFRVSEGNRRDR